MKKKFVLAIIIVLVAIAIVFYSFNKTYPPENTNPLSGNNIIPSYTIEIRVSEFYPPRLVIEPGEKVIWINKDNSPHTVTSPDKELSSAIIPPNGTYSHLFKKEGRFPYNCSLHQVLSGEIIVNS
jgi:plastocyanin